LLPHLGQNFTPGDNVVPQRLQLSDDDTCFPQLPQKVASFCSWTLQFGQVFPPSPLLIKEVPQLTQRLEPESLSVPHLGQLMIGSDITLFHNVGSLT